MSGGLVLGLTGLVDGGEEGEGEDGDEEDDHVYTYGEGKESKAEQHSCITDKRENPHVVMGGDVSMNAKVEA